MIVCLNVGNCDNPSLVSSSTSGFCAKKPWLASVFRAIEAKVLAQKIIREYTEKSKPQNGLKSKDMWKSMMYWPKAVAGKVL